MGAACRQADLFMITPPPRLLRQVPRESPWLYGDPLNEEVGLPTAGSAESLCSEAHLRTDISCAVSGHGMLTMTIILLRDLGLSMLTFKASLWTALVISVALYVVDCWPRH